MIKKTVGVILSVLSLVVLTYYYLFFPRAIVEHTLTSKELEQIKEVKPDILVHKRSKTLFIIKDGLLVQNSDSSFVAWPIALGHSPTGDKSKEGDQKTPQGVYRFTDRSSISGYHGSLHIHYPNSEDAKRGLEEGVLTSEQATNVIKLSDEMKTPPQNTSMGGLILIHGTTKKLPKDSIARHLFTEGCIGMSNKDIFALRSNLPSTESGTVFILP